jgi:dynein heavy chain 2, cytosolic
LEALREAARGGGWVVLQNVHLALSFLPQLEKELATLPLAKGFRLFLTTEVHTHFPPVLLQRSLKVTYEAPPGVKKNLLRTFDSLPAEAFSPGGNPQLMHALAWLHALTQERRSFIPQGWTKFYEFGFADLRSAADIVAKIEGGGEMAGKWPMLHGLLEQAIYGGRIDDDFDLRVLRTYITELFKDATLAGSLRFAPKLKPPSAPSKQAFVDAVRRDLDDNDPPDLFGLPPNIDLIVQQTRSARVIDALKNVAAFEQRDSAFSRDAWAARLGPVLSQWQSAARGGGPRGMRGGDGEPLEVFVAMEFEFGGYLAKKITTRMDALGRVVRGQELLSAATRAAGVRLMAGQTPDEWMDVWEGPEAAGGYLRAVGAKLAALGGWGEYAASGKLLTTPLPLSDLFRPEIFINALKQHTSRKSLRRPLRP